MTFRKVLILAALASLLSACGSVTRPHPKASYSAVAVYVQHPQSLGMLPLKVASRLGLFSQQHLQIDWVKSAQHAAIQVANIGSQYPIDALVTQRPDLVLVAPFPDPHFRLHSLTQLPIVYANSETSQVPYLKAVLSLHHVVPKPLSAMGLPQITASWRQKVLPWVVVPLVDYYQLKRVVPHTTILAFLGASTGPVPVTVITGANKNALAFVSAINLALWYLSTNKPQTIAHLVSDSGASPFSVPIIKQALHYQYWPTTVVLTPSLYQRGQSFLPKSSSWPNYATSVDVKLAEAALTHWPS